MYGKEREMEWEIEREKMYGKERQMEW